MPRRGRILPRPLERSLNGYYRAGRDIIDWVWREDMGNKWHSEQTSKLDTYGIEVTGGYAAEEASCAVSRSRMPG